jgi:hypothetical protein
MATTTNYSWTTPDDTALVKDGAAAIRTLGSSVDTTVKNLNPETTLGDIAYRSSTANVKTRLGLGSAGQVLTVNSGANAPEWATPSSGGMTLLSTTTLSGGATTISSISGSYKQLLFILSNITPDTAASLTMTLNGNTSSIHGMIALNKEAATGSTVTTNNTASWQLTTATNLRTSDTNADGYIYFTDYTDTNKRKNGYFGWNYIGVSNVLCAKAGNLIWTDPAAITSATFTLSTGSFTLGTIKTYGVS